MKQITGDLLIKSSLKVRFYFMLTLSLFETDLGLPPSYLDQLNTKRRKINLLSLKVLKANIDSFTLVLGKKYNVKKPKCHKMQVFIPCSEMLSAPANLKPERVHVSNETVNFERSASGDQS